jgi:broad specificity phosphatase PhoE
MGKTTWVPCHLPRRRLPASGSCAWPTVAPQQQQAAAAGRYPPTNGVIAIYTTWDLLLKHSDEHLQHMSETDETPKYALETWVYSHSNICNILIKHLQHKFETYEKNIRLKHACITIVIYATSRWNAWNIRMKHLKLGFQHAYIITVTYATS